MKLTRSAILALALSLLAVLSALAESPQGEDRLPDVLILHSYNQGNTRTDNLSKGIARALGEQGFSESRMVAYLDSDRLGNSPDYPRLLGATKEMVSVMVRATEPKVAIVTDWTALRFWKQHREALAPGLPVIYCGIGSPPPAFVSEMQGVSGVVEKLAFRETIETAMRLRPKAKKLLVLESSSAYFSVLRSQLDRELAQFAGLLEIHRHDRQDIAAVEERLKSLDDGWIVLAVGRPEAGGIALDSPSASRRIAQASPVPVFATWSTWVGQGVLGGKVMSSELQGYEAGKMAAAVLRGGQASALPAVSYETGSYLFDHAVLKRFGIEEAQLPPGSRVLGKPVSFYEANRPLVWVYGLAMALLAVVSGGLALYAGYRRKVQNQLKEQVNFVQSLMEAMPTPVFYKDTQGVYQGCNKAMEDFIGVPREKLIGRPVHEVFGKKEADHFKRQDDALFAAGPVQIYEFEKQTPDGPRQIRFHKALYRDAAGKVAGLVGVIADVTDLRNAEAEMVRARNYVQAILDSSPSVILVVDAEGRITHLNSKGREECGCSPESFREALPSLAGLMQDVRRAIAEDSTVFPPRIVEGVNGRQRAYDVMIYPLRTIGLSEAVVRVDDVTGRHRMEEMLVQSEKMMSVGGLAAGMAHEINNPLGGIMQSAQVVLTRMRADLPVNRKAAEGAGVPMEGVRAYLDSREIPSLLEGLRDSAKRAAAIVSNMLEFSRRSTSAWLPVDVNGLADKALDLCLQDYNLLENYDFKRIAIVRNYDPANPSVRCSPAQIQQVIFNIVRNAAQAMFAARTPDPSITVSTRLREHCVEVEVADNGPGMDEATKRKVFEPFFTTKGPGEGTGLGLSVSYFIVKENHGGEMQVESEPGAGARFIVSLPLNSLRCLQA